jgi:hypothetical protein
MRLSLNSLLLTVLVTSPVLVANAQTCLNFQNDGEWGQDIQDAAFALRQTLCGGTYDNVDCSELTDTGAYKGNCFAQDPNMSNIQAFMAGPSPGGDNCWVRYAP